MCLICYDCGICHFRLFLLNNFYLLASEINIMEFTVSEATFFSYVLATCLITVVTVAIAHGSVV